MIEVLLTVVPSICWLLLRCYHLLQTPADKLMRRLNVEIPRPPVVCVDSLGRNHVVFHWDQTDENIFYAVMINGKDVGTLAHTQVRLSNLAPDTMYSIQVLAVNAVSNFVAQSMPVYVHTSGGKNKLANTEKIGLQQVPKVAPNPALISEIHAVDVSKVTSESQLVEYLATLQNELTKITVDHELQTASQHEEEDRLRAQIEMYKRQLNEGSDSRAKKDSDLKDLEKQKDSLTFTKLKLSKQLKTFEQHRHLHLSKLAELRSRVAKLWEKQQNALTNAGSERTKVLGMVEATHGEIDGIKLAIAQCEETLRELSTEKKGLVSQAQQLRPLVHMAPASQNASVSDDININVPQAANEMFARDGSLTKTGAQIIQKICTLKPEWEADLNRELEILSGLDSSWKDAFRDAVARYVSLFNSAESARALVNPSHEAQKLTEHQASIQFAGYAHALPKPQTRKKNPILPYLDGSLSPSPPPPESVSRGFYNTPAPAPAPVERSAPSPSFGTEHGVSTPQSLNASMVALHQLGGSGGGGNIIARDYDSNVFTSPNHSFINDHEHQSLDPGSNWLHNQTYPALNQAQYPALNLDASNMRGQSMPFAAENNLYTQTNSYLQPGASAPQPYLGDFQDQQAYTPEIQHPTPTSSLQHYAQNIRHNFPYSDSSSMYQSSPVPEQAYLSSQLQTPATNGLANSLWSNHSQNSFRPFHDYNSLNAAESLHPSVSQQSNLSTDSGLLNSILLPSASHLSTTNSIWSDRYIGGNYGHNRAVSSGSQLWRNEGIRREKSPNSGLVSEFLPFSSNTLPSQNGNAEPQDQSDYDIRSL